MDDRIETSIPREVFHEAVATFYICLRDNRPMHGIYHKYHSHGFSEADLCAVLGAAWQAHVYVNMNGTLVAPREGMNA